MSDFPRNGDTIEVTVGHWPTPRHVLRAADAIDVLCHPRYGAILRAVVEGIERGAVAKPATWEDAKPGDVWVLRLSISDDDETVAIRNAFGGWDSPGLTGRKSHTAIHPGLIRSGFRIYPPTI